MTYILKHWRGQLSLVISFWVNVFLINIGMKIFDFWLTESSPIENPVVASQFTITYVFVGLAIVYPWQIIGLWRSANKHREETKKVLWPRVVKVLVIIGLLGTLGQFNTSLPIYKDLYEIGFRKDEFGEYRVGLIDDGSLIHLEGGLGFGISKEVGRLVDSNPNVKGIILDSNGGRLYEGRELYKIILTNGLDTYTLKGCFSACVIAFISGNKRYLASGANLAFHQYKSNLNSYVDIPSEQIMDKQIYESRGVSREFIDRIFLAKQDDLWYPTIDEMITAGVIHEVVNSSTLIPIQYGSFNANDLEEVLKNNAAFKTIKKYEPETYQQIIQEMEAQLKKGSSSVEIQQSLAGFVQLIASKALPKTSAKALMSFARETINIMIMLREKEPIICMKFVYPEQFGAFAITKYLTSEQLTPMTDVLALVIEDSYKASENTEINTVDAEELILRVVVELGVDANYLDAIGLQNREDYSKACNVIIRFYQLILSNNDKIAVNGLRYAFSL